MNDLKFDEIAKSIFLKRKLNELISLIEWLENQQFMDEIGYNNFAMSALLQLYSISEILNCKNDKNEFNPFYIWAYTFDRYKHFDMLMLEGENLIYRFNNFSDKKGKLLKKKFLIFLKTLIANVNNWNSNDQSKFIEKFFDELSIEERVILMLVHGSNNSRNKDIDTDFFNLQEKFINPIFDSNLNTSKSFWIEHIKPFLKFLISRQVSKGFFNKRNNNQLWKEYIDKNKIKED